MADDLTCGKNGWRKLGAVYNHVQTTLKQTDKVLRRIAFHVAGFLIGALELLFSHVAIIALELLLGAQLDAVVGELAFAALTMLAWAIFAFVYRRFWTSPDVFTHPAVKFVLRAFAHRHIQSPIANNVVSGTARHICDVPDTCFTGMQGRLRSGGYGL